jgi:hypothetical protein
MKAGLRAINRKLGNLDLIVAALYRIRGHKSKRYRQVVTKRNALIAATRRIRTRRVKPG